MLHPLLLTLSLVGCLPSLSPSGKTWEDTASGIDDDGGGDDDGASDDGASDDGSADGGSDDTGAASDADGDGYDSVDAGGTDCDDSDGEVNPGAIEVPYDGVDNDCDGATPDDDLDGDGWGYSEDCDDTDADLNYDDADGDGYTTCPGEGGADCDDDTYEVNPGAEEVAYDEVDQDCDGGDLTDVDGDGYSGAGDDPEDCDDGDAAVNPGAEEIPYDEVDQDCDGEDLVDVDGDGFSGAGDAPEDCDDDAYEVNPDAEEIAYDGLDNDCLDGDLTDVDGDGYDGGEVGGDDGVAYDCDDDDAALNLDDLDGDGVTTCDGDCDDEDSGALPGGEEIPYDGVDNDCDGGDLTDVDGDGYDAIEAGGSDCEDGYVEVNPGAAEVCDGLDNNCDGGVDEDWWDAYDASTGADNDTAEVASYLGTIDGSWDDMVTASFSGLTLTAEGQEDWYYFYTNDTWTEPAFGYVTLSGLDESLQWTVEIYDPNYGEIYRISDETGTGEVEVYYDGYLLSDDDDYFGIRVFATGWPEDGSVCDVSYTMTIEAG
jgi:hypothetical protein